MLQDVRPALADESEPSAPLSSSQAAAGAETGSGRLAKNNDPLSFIDGSPENWFVSKSDAGCYLMSPYRKDSSRLAIGKHPIFGTGLFAINFGVATSGPNAPVSLTIATDDHALQKEGHVIGAGLLFVPLSPAELESSVAVLRGNGVLWLVVMHTSIMHEGQSIEPAVVDYQKTCSGLAIPSG